MMRRTGDCGTRSTFTIPRSLSRALCLLAPQLLSLVCLPPAVAAPDKPRPLVVNDIVADPDLRDEAMGITLLLRASLNAPAHPVIDAGQLRAAVGRVAPKDGPRYALVVQPAQHRALLRALGASHLVVGQLVRQGTALSASLQIVGPKGQRSAATARMHSARLPQLSYLLAQRVAKALQLSPPHDVRDIAPAALLPFVRAAQALLRERATDAATALRAADPAIAARLVDTPALIKEVVDQDGLALDQRVLSALALGAAKRATGLARAARDGAKNSYQRKRALAAQSLALVELGQHKQAKRLLRRLGRESTQPLARLAWADLYRASGRAKKSDAILIELVKAGDLAALSRVARLPRNIPSPQLLATAFLAAEGLDGRRYRGLRATIALRAALRAQDIGLPLDRLLRLVDADVLPAQQTATLRLLAEDGVSSGSTMGYRLRAELASQKSEHSQAIAQLERAVKQAPDDRRSRMLLARALVDGGQHDKAAGLLRALAKEDATARFELARTLDLGGKRDESAALRRELAGDPMARAASAARLALEPADEADGDEERDGPTGARQIALEKQRFDGALERVRSMLRTFPPLGSGELMSVALVQHSGGTQLPLWPLVSQPEQLRRALRQTLRRPPYTLSVSSTDRRVAALSTSALSALAKRLEVDALLLYSASPSGAGRAEIRLVVYLAAKEQALEFSETTAGFATGLVRWNRSFLLVAGVLLLLVLAWIAFKLVRGYGELNVTVALDPAAKKEALTLLVNAKQRPPTIKDPKRYAAGVLAGAARQSSTKATRIHKRTRFRRIPAGQRYVHLYGTYEKEGQVQVLPDSLSQSVPIKRGKVAQVTFDLEPQSYRLELRVFDNEQPIRGASVWLGDNQAQQRLTDAAGQVVLQVPRGERQTVHISCSEMHLRRTLDFNDTKTHSLTVNLAKERKMRELSGGISLDGEALSTSHEAQAQAASFNEIEIAGQSHALATGDTVRGDTARGGAAPTDIVQGTAATAAATPAALATSGGGDTGAQGTMLAWGGGSTAPTPASNPTTLGDGHATAAHKPANAMSGLNRYQPIAELGRGAMGIVHRAMDRVLEREVALKVIGAELRQHPIALKLFQQEAKALAKLNHPNVVTVFDQGQDGENTYMVMEFVDGRTLEHIIEASGPLPLSQGLDVALQLCVGLAYAHGQQIIHRDIKPENVFISPDGRVKLGDFGLARVIRELSIQKTEVRGTPLFMAPEQIRGTDIDFRADIYSLGCTLYSVFAGRPPFLEGEILYHHLHTPPPPPSQLNPQLPPTIDDLLLQCVAKNKEERVPSVEALRSRIEPLKRQVA